MSCSQPVNVVNVAPSVAGIGPVINDNGTVSIVFWVRDHEENAVDVFFEVIQDGQASPINVFGGHGDIGLTTSRENTGRAHVVLWKADDIDLDTPIKLRLQAQDDYGTQGPPLETVEFTLNAGLPPL